MLSSLGSVHHPHVTETLSHLGSWKLTNSLGFKALLTVVLWSCALFVQDLPPTSVWLPVMQN